jgi:integrase
MIYKRKGHWHLDVTIHGVRYREALDTTDKREALGLEKKRIGEIQQGKAASKSGREFARKPFAEAAKLFIEDRVGHVAERTIQFERERLRPLSSYFGERPLFRIKAEDIAAYQRARMAAGLSGKTINMDIGVLRLMMKRAKCWSAIADDVKMFPKRSRVVGKVLTHEQKMHLFQTAASKPDWLVAHCAAVLAVSSTCRGVELKNLRWQHIDLFNIDPLKRTMAIRRSKTDAGHRTIPLNGDATAALARLWERARAEKASGSDHFVFPACENGLIDPTRPQKSWRSAWRSLVKEAATRAGRDAARAALSARRGIGVAKSAWKRAAAPFLGFRFHDLRHQAITELAELAASDAALMAVAGHMDRAMLEHYSHVRMAAKRDLLDKLSSGLMGIPAPAIHRQSEKIN